MEFSRLRLDHFKCYEAIDVEFVPGTTVVHGVNGSGKSTLLEACFFALYGTDALPGGRTLDAIITKGERETEVELWFTHGDHQYRVLRSVRETESQVIHEALVETPQGQFSGVRSVDQKLREILRMDAEAFLNCAYVRQGDITRLLTASPEERQAIIDNLLQLGKLETYRERMDNARLGVVHVRKDRESRLRKLEEEIDALESENLEERLAAVNAEIEEIDTALEDLLDTRESIQEELDAIEEELSTQTEKKASLTEIESQLADARAKRDDCTERIESLEEDIEDLETTIESHLEAASEGLDTCGVDVSLPADPSPDSLEKPQTAVRAQLEEREATRDRLADEVDELREAAQEAAAESQRLSEQADSLREQAEEAEERADEWQDKISDHRETLAEKQDEKETLQERISELKAAFDDSTVPDDIEFGDAEDYRDDVDDELETVREREQELENKCSALRDRIDHAEQLIAEGKCPECGQTVENAPSVEALEDNRERLAELEAAREAVVETRADLESEREQAADLVATEQQVSNLRSQVETAEEFIHNVENEIEAKQTEAEQAAAEAAEKRTEADEKARLATEQEEKRDSLITEIEATTNDLQAAEEAVEVLESVIDSITAIEHGSVRRQSLRQQIDDVESLREEHESRIAELEAEQEVLESALDPDRIEELQEQKSAAESRLEELAEKEEALESQRDDLTETRGEISTKRSQLEAKQEEVADLEDWVDVLAALVRECADLRDMYARLRRELRQQNVAQLELLVNEIFDLVYESDAYARIELSDTYELTVHEKGGETLAPDELSGGEKALFNLSLRCAIYQLLVEGTGNAALPPLILDEPTVHLDAEHINRIGALVDRMRDLGVSQTIVVSHESEIVDSADERIEVLQDPGSNRSQVSVESTDLLADIEL